MCLYRNEKAALGDDLWVLLISPKGSALLFICRLQSLFQLSNQFHNLNNYLNHTGVQWNRGSRLSSAMHSVVSLYPVYPWRQDKEDKAKASNRDT